MRCVHCCHLLNPPVYSFPLLLDMKIVLNLFGEGPGSSAFFITFIKNALFPVFYVHKSCWGLEWWSGRKEHLPLFQRPKFAYQQPHLVLIASWNSSSRGLKPSLTSVGTCHMWRDIDIFRLHRSESGFVKNTSTLSKNQRFVPSANVRWLTNTVSTRPADLRLRTSAVTFTSSHIFTQTCTDIQKEQLSLH